MKTNEAGRRLIQEFETCHLKAYPDPKTGGEPWTCGWGSTGPDVTKDTVWTQAKADARFLIDLEGAEREVMRAVKVPLNPNQFSALVSIVQNVGGGRISLPGKEGRDGIIRLKNGQPSTLLRKLNAGDYQGAADEFLRWVSPGSNVEKGLRRRRTRERDLFLTPAEREINYRFEMVKRGGEPPRFSFLVFGTPTGPLRNIHTASCQIIVKDGIGHFDTIQGDDFYLSLNRGGLDALTRCGTRRFEGDMLPANVMTMQRHLDGKAEIEVVNDVVAGGALFKHVKLTVL